MTHDNVVDSAAWLLERAEALTARRDPAAETYWRRLLADNQLEERTRPHALTQLGVCLFRRDAFGEARQTFEAAREAGASESFIDYALGHCALSTHDRAAIVPLLRAVVGVRGTSDEPEYMRTLSVALRDLGFHDAALAILKGAAERAPNQPAILEALGLQYERMKNWVEAIRVRDQLIELLKRNLPVQFRHEVVLDTTEIAPQKAEKDVRVINETLRRAFMVVLPDDDFQEADGALSLTTHPAGLHTLVTSLASRDEPEPLLLCAQRLWALSRHDRLDEHVSPYVLAATIQWLAERATWRLPTSSMVLKASYGVEEEQIKASARWLLSRYDVGTLPLNKLRGVLSKAEFEEVSRLLQAVMLDLELAELDGPKMLI
ncbi:MAG: hypothetical protein R3E66_06570 [bacterium]